VQLAAADYERRRWVAIDPAAAPDLDFLNTALSGDLDILSRSADDRVWLVREVPNDAPARCHAYLRDESQLVLLFSDRESLLQFPLSPRTPYVLDARDGLQLVSYLTLPPGTPCQPNGRPESPLPFILYVHGGPTLRDDWGYGLLHQWLANRGYAVLCVNFRGSAGFGKSFRAAGNQQWGRAMQDDLMDAVQWAVDGGIADAEKLAIMGPSYGGYTTIAALGLVPEYFACGVSMVSPMDLVAMLQSIPQHWTPFIEQVLMEVGDYRTPEGQIDLRSRSPVTFAKQIQRPMLIVQGGLEPPERLTLSLQVARELESRGVRVIYVVFPDEGHVFESPKNLAALAAITDWFLAFTLGGRTEETLEAVMSRSSARVEVGR
jgi:dipeptidyl aminopeptidase/acylaminoacyl peptidase